MHPRKLDQPPFGVRDSSLGALCAQPAQIGSMDVPNAAGFACHSRTDETLRGEDVIWVSSVIGAVLSNASVCPVTPARP